MAIEKTNYISFDFSGEILVHTDTSHRVDLRCIPDDILYCICTEKHTGRVDKPFGGRFAGWSLDGAWH